jgi:hypothetical protein
MTTINDLQTAISDRIRLENRFKQSITNKLVHILRTLQDCPPLPPGTPAANALTITRDQLDAFIRELQNDTNINEAAAIEIANTMNRQDLRRTGGPIGNNSVPSAQPLIPDWSSAPGAQPQSRGFLERLFGRSASTSNPIRTSVNNFTGSSDRSYSTDPFNPPLGFDRELRRPNSSVRVGPGGPSGSIGGSRKSKRARKTRKN